jgi:hypothetical protein
MEIINTNRELIIKCLNREYKDSNPLLFVYICGQDRARETAITQILKYTNIVFNGCSFRQDFVINCIKEFLDFKRHQFINDEIEIKTLY